MQNPGKKTLVYIMSDVRSGSTLLDFLLGNHPDAQSVGELRFFETHVNREGVGHSWNWKCTCGKTLESCQLWSKVIERLDGDGVRKASELSTCTSINQDGFERTTFFVALFVFFCGLSSLKRSLTKIFWRGGGRANVAEDCFAILREVCAVTGKNIVIDSSKSPDHLHTLLAAVPKEFNVKVIHLIRDGRAVTFSKLTRAQQFGKPLRCRSAVLGWVKTNLMASNVLSLLSAGDFVTIRYEELCNDTENVIRGVCTALGISFSDDQIRLSKENSHNIGGSQHRFSKDRDIRLDERWKHGMGIKERAIFAFFGGWLNLTTRIRWSRVHLREQDDR